MAVVSKILETTLTIGNTSVVFTDNDIPNSLIRVFTNKPDVIPTSITMSGSSITVSFTAQTSILYVALEIVKSGFSIIDSLTSTSDNDALSAKQGKILKDAIDGIVIPTVPDVINNVTSDSTTDALSAAQGKYLKGLIDAIPTVPQNIDDLDDVDISTPINGQVLKYNSVSEKWENVTSSGQYTTTQLWTGNMTSTGDQVLSDSIENYDTIMLVWSTHGSNTAYYNRILYIPVNKINYSLPGNVFAQFNYSYYPDATHWAYIACGFKNSTTFNLAEKNAGSIASVTILSITGIKY